MSIRKLRFDLPKAYQTQNTGRNETLESVLQSSHDHRQYGGYMNNGGIVIDPFNTQQTISSPTSITSSEPQPQTDMKLGRSNSNLRPASSDRPSRQSRSATKQKGQSDSDYSTSSLMRRSRSAGRQFIALSDGGDEFLISVR